MEFPEQIETRMKKLAVVSIEVIVNEDHVLFADRRDLSPDVVEVVRLVASMFGGERTKAAAKIAVSA